jgi:hypothetical protein
MPGKSETAPPPDPLADEPWRPHPRDPAHRHRRLLYLALGIPLAVVVILAGLVASGSLTERVTVTSVAVRDSAGEIAGGLATPGPISASTSSTLIVKLAVNSSLSSGWESCVTGASTSVTGFAVEGLSPGSLCIGGQGSADLYLTLGTPSSAYDGPLVVTLQDYSAPSSTT